MRQHQCTVPFVSSPCRLGRSVKRSGSSHKSALPALSERIQPGKFHLPDFGSRSTEYDTALSDLDSSRKESAFEQVQEAPEGYWVEKIEGKIPAEIHGTYFRNGPGDFNFLNEPVAFSFDANGIMGSVAIKDGRAFFRSRFVKTEHSMLEERAGRRLFKGPFGTMPKHGVIPFAEFVIRNAGNGKPFIARDTLYAPYEGAPHSELDPYTLETVYPKLPEGLLPATAQIISQQFSFLANMLDSPLESVRLLPDFLDLRSVYGIGDHKYDAKRNVTICHNYKPKMVPSSSLVGMEIKMYEFEENLRLRSQQTYTIDSFSAAHSIGVSENYYVVNKFPFSFDVEKMLDPNAGLAECVRWDSSGAHEFHLVPRPKNRGGQTIKKARIVKLQETSFVFHFINVFEEDDWVVIDAIHMPGYPDMTGTTEPKEKFKKASEAKSNDPRWRRTTVSPNGDIDTQEVSHSALEVPSINPRFLGRPYRYVYAFVGLDPQGTKHTALGKISLETGELDVWTKGTHYSVGEPLFVPRPDSLEEDDGWVMAFCYNEHTSKTEFVIMDAKNINKGPLAILYLDHSVARGFHGNWSNKYYGP